jgi:hypothetical protein
VCGRQFFSYLVEDEAAIHQKMRSPSHASLAVQKNSHDIKFMVNSFKKTTMAQKLSDGCIGILSLRHSGATWSRSGGLIHL